MMQQNKFVLFILIILTIYSDSFIAEAYDNNFVHQIINGNAAQQSIKFQNTIKNYGFKNIYDVVNKKEIWQWFYDGAKLEDETVCRSRNHFHDPLKSWDKAGFNNLAINTLCASPLFKDRFWVDSSIIWSQKKSDNLYSWVKAREYYYKALTIQSKEAREANLAQSFRAVGQVMHLLADASVPEHVRNDLHVFPLNEKTEIIGPSLKGGYPWYTYL